MSGWYVVYLMCCALNGVLLTSMGYGLKTWQFWVYILLFVLVRASGLYSK